MAVRFAIFQGTDSAGDRGLWVTDGTAGGTYELTGVGGAYAGGLFGGPTGFAPTSQPSTARCCLAASTRMATSDYG
jgi:ELWxxDGT repeat protein